MSSCGPYTQYSRLWTSLGTETVTDDIAASLNQFDVSVFLCCVVLIVLIFIGSWGSPEEFLQFLLSVCFKGVAFQAPFVPFLLQWDGYVAWWKVVNGPTVIKSSNSNFLSDYGRTGFLLKFSYLPTAYSKAGTQRVVTPNWKRQQVYFVQIGELHCKLGVWYHCICRVCSLQILSCSLFLAGSLGHWAIHKKSAQTHANGWW